MADAAGAVDRLLDYLNAQERELKKLDRCVRDFARAYAVGNRRRQDSAEVRLYNCQNALQNSTLEAVRAGVLRRV